MACDSCGRRAEVVIGSEIRRGAVTADGKGEVVMGLGFMLLGENTHQVTWAMKDTARRDQADAARQRERDDGLRSNGIVDHVINQQ